MTPERKDRTRFRSKEIKWMLLLLLFGIASGVVCALIWRRHGELSRIFVTGTVTLFFGALLGGVVSLLIADFDRRRIQRAAQIDFISNILTELKGVYDRVDRGRTLIAAQQSAKTYREQMLEFIDARVKLLAIDRALRFDERRAPIQGVLDDVREMEKYLHSLTREFIAHYKGISRSQSRYEARMKKALESSTKLPKNKPWDLLARLENLQDFLLPTHVENTGHAQRSRYSRFFLDTLDAASEKLRQALEAELSR